MMTHSPTSSDRSDRRFSVLVVDDIESIRTSIRDSLSGDFNTRAAADGFEAVRVCEQQHIDLVITDIRMPGMGGLQLIKKLTPLYPDMKFALMTAYSVDDYIEFVRTEKVWNIIPKSMSMDLNFIRVMAHKLLTGEIFGIQRYYPRAELIDARMSDIHRMHRGLEDKDRAREGDGGEGLTPGHFYTCRITTPEENNAICDMAGDLLTAAGAPSMVRLVLEELAANAMIHAPAKPGDERPRPVNRPGMPNGEYIPMNEEDAFDVSFGLINHNAVLAITDYHGTMDREEILYRLERQVTPDPATGLPMGLVDTHGRGLYISREQADYLIFNIAPGRCTEIIGVLPVEGDATVRNRAIAIFQRD